MGIVSVDIMAKKKHPKINKRVILTAAGVVGLLVGVALVGLIAQKVINPGQQGPNVSKEAQEGGVADVPAPPSQEVVEIQKLREDGKYEEANKKISEALQKSDTSNDFKYDVYLEQGLTYENNEQFQEAYASYAKAAEFKKTRAVYGAIGEVAVRLGKTQEAISAYRDAIKYISQDSALKDYDKRMFEQKIRDLGGQP